MTDLTNVEHLPPRPARRRKASAPPAEAPALSIDGNIAMVLGELTGVVAGVQNSVHEMKEDARRDREESSNSRRRLYERLDELKDQVHEIDKKVGRVLDVDSRLGLVEAEVAKTKRIREWAGHILARGWKIGLAIAGVTAGSVAVWFRDQIGAVFSRISNLFM